MRKTLKSLISISLILGFFGAGILLFVFVTIPLPDVSSFESIKPIQSIKLLDRNGNLLFDFSENIQRNNVPISDISENLIKATLSIEDDNFYKHRGIYFPALLRSTLINLREGGFSQGGSTITQQVVKNLLLTADKKIVRKIKEAVISLKIERVLEKDEILEIYLNSVAYGGTIYGISEAARFFFDKNPKEVTLAEAAYLAALPRAPSFYSPHGNNRDALIDRKNYILGRMLNLGLIDRDEYLVAFKENVVFETQRRFSIQAPHFVFLAKEELENRFNIDISTLQGQEIKTTIDPDLQKGIEKQIAAFSGELESRLGASNIAVVVLSAKTGEVLSLVGSRDYFDEEIDGEVNAATSDRQPGSAFKPISYSQVFERGFLPETIVYDVPTQFSLGCDEDILETNKNCYSPKNFDDVFVGPINLRNALAQSRNIPAVKVLYLAGLGEVFAFAKASGLKSLNPTSLNLSLALGGADVTLLELVNIYATFANEGEFVPYRWTTEGESTQLTFGETTKTLSEKSARYINDVLSNNVARSRVFPGLSILFRNKPNIAIKTGTTNNNRDIWMLGYTPDIVVGIWAGNNQGEPLAENAVGASLGGLWARIFDLVGSEYEKGRVFNKNSLQDIDGLSPIVYGGVDSLIKNRGGDVEAHSVLHFVSAQNPTEGSGERDPQYEHWEYAVSEWAEDKTNQLKIKNFLQQKRSVLNVDSGLFISFPYSGTIDYRQEVEIKLGGGLSSFASYEFYVNGNLIGKTHLPVISFVPRNIGVGRSSNFSVSVIGYTNEGFQRVDAVFLETSPGENSLTMRLDPDNNRYEDFIPTAPVKNFVPLPVPFPTF